MDILLYYICYLSWMWFLNADLLFESAPPAAVFQTFFKTTAFL